MYQPIRSLIFDIKYLFCEIGLKIKHPTRPTDIKIHLRGIFNTLFWHPLYCLKRGIKNLYNYFTIIWGTDVWDHTYLTELMDKKMEEMEKFFLSENTHLMNSNHVAKRIKWTRKLYSMWKEDYYSTQHYDKHHEQFDPDKHNSLFEPLNSRAVEWDEWGEPTLFESVNKMSDEEAKSWREGSDIAHKKDKKVYDLYMKNLKNSLPSWWD